MGKEIQPLLIVTTLLVLFSGTMASGFKRVCYYAPKHHIQVDMNALNHTLCTHIIYGFAHVSSDNTLVPKNSTVDPSRYKKFNEHLQKEAPHVTRLLCVSEGNFSEMTRHSEHRSTFIQSALEKLEEWKFHGLDIDWEFPNKHNKAPHDKKNFQTFLQEAYKAFQPENITLTIAVPGWSRDIENGFDAAMVAKISEWISFANLMSYDYNVFSKQYRNFTGPNSPLHAWSTLHNPHSREDTRFLTWSAENWTNALNMKKEKLVVGVSFFGRRFKLQDQSKHGFLAPALPLETDRQIKKKVKVDAKVSYSWTCHFLVKSGTTKVWDSASHTPYAYKGDQWVSYDDENSVRDKVRWIVQNGYGGVMTYTLNDDDMNGDCEKAKKPRNSGLAKSKKFPLQQTVYELTQTVSVSKGSNK